MAADLDASASMLDVLQDLHHDIDRLHELDLTALADAELVESLRETERAIRRLPAGRNAAVAEVKARGLAGQHGCRSNQAFLRQLLGWSAAEAGSCLAQADDLVGGRSLSTGEQLPPRFPILREAVAAGEVSPEQVRLIRHTLIRIPAGVDAPTVAAAERKLVEVGVSAPLCKCVTGSLCQARLSRPGNMMSNWLIAVFHT